MDRDGMQELRLLLDSVLDRIVRANAVEILTVAVEFNVVLYQHQLYVSFVVAGGRHMAVSAVVPRGTGIPVAFDIGLSRHCEAYCREALADHLPAQRRAPAINAQGLRVYNADADANNYTDDLRVLVRYGYAVFRPGVGIQTGDDEQAEKRAMELLLDRLTPDQRTEWDAHQSFTVVGSESGRRYRIHRGTNINIAVLNRKGEEEGRICFLPTGPLATGDVMLAQKVMLETDEPAALKIANRFGPQRGRNGMLGVWSETSRFLRNLGW